MEEEFASTFLIWKHYSHLLAVSTVLLYCRMHLMVSYIFKQENSESFQLHIDISPLPHIQYTD